MNIKLKLSNRNPEILRAVGSVRTCVARATKNALGVNSIPRACPGDVPDAAYSVDEGDSECTEDGEALLAQSLPLPCRSNGFSTSSAPEEACAWDLCVERPRTAARRSTRLGQGREGRWWRAATRPRGRDGDESDEDDGEDDDGLGLGTPSIDASCGICSMDSRVTAARRRMEARIEVGGGGGAVTDAEMRCVRDGREERGRWCETEGNEAVVVEVESECASAVPMALYTGIKTSPMSLPMLARLRCVTVAVLTADAAESSHTARLGRAASVYTTGRASGSAVKRNTARFSLAGLVRRECERPRDERMGSDDR
jgi:hypothetical protein